MNILQGAAPLGGRGRRTVRGRRFVYEWLGLGVKLAGVRIWLPNMAGKLYTKGCDFLDVPSSVVPSIFSRPMVIIAVHRHLVESSVHPSGTPTSYIMTFLLPFSYTAIPPPDLFSVTVSHPSVTSPDEAIRLSPLTMASRRSPTSADIQSIAADAVQEAFVEEPRLQVVRKSSFFLP